MDKCLRKFLEPFMPARGQEKQFKEESRFRHQINHSSAFCSPMHDFHDTHFSSPCTHDCNAELHPLNLNARFYTMQECKDELISANSFLALLGQP